MVTNSWGNSVYDATGTIVSNPFCIWNGYDTDAGGFADDGVYSYILDIYNECSEHQQYNGFIHIYNDLNPGLTQNNNQSNNSHMDSLKTINRVEPKGNEQNVINNSLNYRLVPNPANEQCYVSGNIESVLLIEVYAVSGSLMLSQKEASKAIDISSFAAGMYLVHLHTMNGIQILKLEKR